MVGLSGERSFVVADIPGLIEGAHAGAGLGDRFLRHLDRTRLLVHLLDASAGEPGRTPLRDYEAMNRELALYDPELAARPQLVVLNKIDLPDVRKRAKQIARPFARRGITLPRISAATGEGTAELLESIWRALPPRHRVDLASLAFDGQCCERSRRLATNPRKAEGIDHTCVGLIKNPLRFVTALDPVTARSGETASRVLHQLLRGSVNPNTPLNA